MASTAQLCCQLIYQFPVLPAAAIIHQKHQVEFRSGEIPVYVEFFNGTTRPFIA